MRRDDLAAGGGPVLLLTRPKDRAAEFADAVQARLARPVPVLVSPLVEIVPLGVTPDIARDAVLLFTSAAGPASLGPHYDAAGRWAYCVGDRTADAARAAGFRARSADGDAAALARLVREAAPVAPLVHVRGAHAKGDLAGRLSAAGFQVSECVTYRQQECPPAPELVRLLSGACDVVAPVFSPRGVPGSRRRPKGGRRGCMSSRSAARPRRPSERPPTASTSRQVPPAGPCSPR